MRRSSWIKSSIRLDTSTANIATSSRRPSTIWTRYSRTSRRRSSLAVLDNATKQLDQVIDQARHKHSQHRNKFKEAIDYLDQIFEDLKKEVEPGVEDKIKERNVAPTAVPAKHATNSPPDNIR
ncbi:hypothetical protein OESDEN_18570 [Oesophagostomum dentatum]|uniref:Uncharacterized protein n=1 Tax=Oesophagostomum dentatum TaxID=61180 RepID=A0A0B1SDY7_OESDE|nr:hypothetical protein OESDEN_18570 [Oesophagostomum dentatum]